MAKHQTLRKEVKVGVKLLRGHDEVKKIIIGRYENCRHRYAPGAFKTMSKTKSGFKLKAFDGSGVHDLHVYLKTPLSAAARTLVEAYIKHVSR